MMVKSKVFTLKKYDGNAFILDDGILLTTALWEDESRTPPYDDENWGEVDIEAFETDEEYREIYELANDPKERIIIE
jgi:hypothetical protein